jgi:hypothetical protein
MAMKGRSSQAGADRYEVVVRHVDNAVERLQRDVGRLDDAYTRLNYRVNSELIKAGELLESEPLRRAIDKGIDGRVDPLMADLDILRGEVMSLRSIIVKRDNATARGSVSGVSGVMRCLKYEARKQASELGRGKERLWEHDRLCDVLIMDVASLKHEVHSLKDERLPVFSQEMEGLRRLVDELRTGRDGGGRDGHPSAWRHGVDVSLQWLKRELRKRGSAAIRGEDMRCIKYELRVLKHALSGSSEAVCAPGADSMGVPREGGRPGVPTFRYEASGARRDGSPSVDGKESSPLVSMGRDLRHLRKELRKQIDKLVRVNDLMSQLEASHKCDHRFIDGLAQRVRAMEVRVDTCTTRIKISSLIV